MRDIFIKGLIIGFAIAAPVGPIGLLCINRSLVNGFKIGLMIGVGDALADGAYGCIAAFGLTAVSAWLVSHQLWIRGIGGLFLIYLGCKLFFTKSHDQTLNDIGEKSVWHAFTTTFFLTLTNPMTILSFAAIFAGLGVGTEHPNFIHATMMVAGVIVGSTSWWFILSGSVTYFLHHKMNEKTRRLIDTLSGLIILLFGLVSL